MRSVKGFAERNERDEKRERVMRVEELDATQREAGWGGGGDWVHFKVFTGAGSWYGKQMADG